MRVTDKSIQATLGCNIYMIVPKCQNFIRFFALCYLPAVVPQLSHFALVVVDHVQHPAKHRRAPVAMRKATHTGWSVTELMVRLRSHCWSAREFCWTALLQMRWKA